MNDRIKREIYQIEIPKEIGQKSRLGVSKAKEEMERSDRKNYTKGIAAAILVFFGIFLLFTNDSAPNQTGNHQKALVTEEGGIKIPPIQLPERNGNADMLGLIVYNGKIYAQTSTEIEAEYAKTILGEKLGTTKGTIDEWSKQEAYEKEFASSIGIEDVYSVKGYDRDFRIMAYGERYGKPYAEIFENLNGITVKSGTDVFGKLKMVGNLSSAKFRTYSDWDYSRNYYHPIRDMNLVKAFVNELNKTKPYLRGENSDPISNSRNDENFRELTIQLKDGTNVKLLLLKDGYIYYGYMGVYFKMDDRIFSKLWDQMD